MLLIELLDATGGGVSGVGRLLRPLEALLGICGPEKALTTLVLKGITVLGDLRKTHVWSCY